MNQTYQKIIQYVDISLSKYNLHQLPLRTSQSSLSDVSYT